MKPTVHFGADVIDGDTFFASTMRSATALAGLGIGLRTVVALMLRNEPVMLELMMAARWLGAHWCPINWHFKTAEVRHMLSDSGARALIVHADLLPQIEGAVPDGLPVFVVEAHAHTRAAGHIDDPMPPAARDLPRWTALRDAATGPVPPQQAPGSQMVYTSGTTGLPKGIRREPPTPKQVADLMAVTRLALGVEPGMRALLSAPLYHSAPTSYAVQCMLVDAQLVLEPRFDAERTLQLIEAQRLSHLYLVPTMYVRLLGLPEAVRRHHDLSSVRFVASTGSPCPPEVKRRMIDWWGPVFHEAYAASELGWVTHIDSAGSLRKPGSAGCALPGVALKVLSDDGQELPTGEVGLLHARSDAVPDFTYANNDAARRRLEHDGLWTLGDMGYLDDEGYVFIVDRKNDMVISGGVNIYPFEIEAMLMTMPGVADCAVFGVPDDEFGEAVLAVVQLVQPGAASEAEVQAFLRQRLAAYKVPRQVVFHDQLPREDTGKIFKRKLREPYWAGRQRRV